MPARSALSSCTFVKLLHYALAGSALLSLCACTVASTPTAPTAVATVDALSLANGFEPSFYRAFVQNAYEAPDHLEPVRLLRGLRVYLRTEDDSGAPVDRVTLDATERTLVSTARIWSGDTFGIAEVARGSSTREKVSGWVTVKWTNNPASEHCGRSTVGIDGGYIELNLSGSCSCGMATRVYPRVVRHELGHAMGYYHTDDFRDVMYGKSISSATCDLLPSDRERLHAKYAHTQTR